MRGATVSSCSLACATPAAVPPLSPRSWRASASGGGHGRQLLRNDLLPSAVLCRARSQSSSSSNVNFGRGDNADKLLEDLLKQHGEVVYSSGGSTAAEADDDAECLSFAVSLAKAASDIKAVDIRVLCVKRLVYWTRFFIILTAFSNAQIDAIRCQSCFLFEHRDDLTTCTIREILVRSSLAKLHLVTRNQTLGPYLTLGMLLSIYFFRNSEHSTIWKSSTVTPHQSNSPSTPNGSDWNLNFTGSCCNQAIDF